MDGFKAVPVMSTVVETWVEERMRQVEATLLARMESHFKAVQSREESLQSRKKKDASDTHGLSQNAPTDLKREVSDDDTRRRKKRSRVEAESANMASLQRFADSMVDKVQDIEARLDVLEVRASLMEDLQKKFVETSTSLLQTERLVGKHQTAMLQMREYLTQHQDFIDGMCKTLGIRFPGAEVDQKTLETPVQAIEDLFKHLGFLRENLDVAFERLKSMAQDLAALKQHLGEVSASATDWARSREHVMRVLHGTPLPIQYVSGPTM